MYDDTTLPFKKSHKLDVLIFGGITTNIWIWLEHALRKLRPKRLMNNSSLYRFADVVVGFQICQPSLDIGRVHNRDSTISVCVGNRFI